MIMVLNTIKDIYLFLSYFEINTDGTYKYEEILKILCGEGEELPPSVRRLPALPASKSF